MILRQYIGFRGYVSTCDIQHLYLLGSEWRYVIISTVCSLPKEEIESDPDKGWLYKHVGFVGDPNQINVGITRAKEGLCIIGEIPKLIFVVQLKVRVLMFVAKIHNSNVSPLLKETKSCSVAVHHGESS